MILLNSTIFAIIYIKLLSLPILGFNIMQCKNHCFAIIGMYFPLTVYICWIIFWIVRTCNVSMGSIINNQRSFIPAGVNCRYTNYCIWNYKMIGECRFVVNRKCTILKIATLCLLKQVAFDLPCSYVIAKPGAV